MFYYFRIFIDVARRIACIFYTTAMMTRVNNYSWTEW